MAKLEKKHERGTCTGCGATDIRLVGVSTKKGGKICGVCFAEVKQAPLGFDQYDLRPDEMTVDMLRDKAGGPTRRTIQNWNRDGKIAYTMQRRRIDGVIRKQVIYKVADAEAFLATLNNTMHSPGLHSPNTNGGENGVSPGVAFDIIEKLATVMQSTQPLQQARVFDCPPLKRMGIKEAALLSGIAESHLAAAIKAAEQNGLIEHYTGAFGTNVYRADQIEFVIANMPPTPKRLRAAPSIAGIAEKSDNRSTIAETSDAIPSSETASLEQQ